MTGFDPQLVQNSINDVEAAYTDLMQAMGTNMQTQFVNEMANCWACAEAQTFFNNNFKPVVDELLNGTYAIFESVVNAMNSAAQVWSMQTGAEWVSKTFTGEKKSIDTSNIKENINGVRGVDEANANSTAERLAVIASDVDNALSKAQQAVTNCGFVGADMEAQLINSLQTIRNNVNNATQELTQSTKTAITQTVQTYGNIARKVENAFTA